VSAVVKTLTTSDNVAIIMGTDEIPRLISLLSPAHSVDVRGHAACALFLCCHSVESDASAAAACAAPSVDCGGIPLTALLSAQSPQLHAFALSAIFRVMASHERARTIVSATGNVAPLISLLGSPAIVNGLQKAATAALVLKVLRHD
jgi:hypothetical protein